MHERDAHIHLAAPEVGRALGYMRDGRDIDANKVLIHLVHDGVWPVDVIAEVIEQTGGTL
jgi:hypothetical protein